MRNFLMTLVMLAGTILGFTSCKTYDLYADLDKVYTETIKDGECISKTLNSNPDGRLQYEDLVHDIKFRWLFGEKNFYFDLTNNSNYSVKINWDDVEYTDIHNKTSLVTHTGVRYISVVHNNMSQRMTNVHPGETFTDSVVPIDNVYWSVFNKWKEIDLISKKDAKVIKPNSNIKITFPIYTRGTQVNYTFIFKINKL